MQKPLRLLLEEKLGRRIRYPKECDALAVAIRESIGERISSSTLKRIFGFIQPASSPSLYTLDLLSIFLGYNDWEDLENEFELRLKRSGTPGNTVSLPFEVEPGNMLEVCYSPDKKLVLQLIEDGSFCIIQSEKSALKEKDLVELFNITEGDYLFFNSVVRGSKNLGPFISLRNSKVISIRSMENETNPG